MQRTAAVGPSARRLGEAAVAQATRALLLAPCRPAWAPSRPPLPRSRRQGVARASLQGAGGHSLAAAALPAAACCLALLVGRGHPPLFLLALAPASRLACTPDAACLCFPVPPGPAAAPSLSDDPEQPSTSGRPPPPPPAPGGGGPSPARLLWKRTVRQLANLKLAIAELAVIGGLSAVGTVIKQGEDYAYYAQVRRAGWWLVVQAEVHLLLLLLLGACGAGCA